MLERPLGQEATNAVRKLFQINRVETAAAMMSEFVLVPEGKLDFDWLTLLTRVAELDQNSEEPCLFGVRVGLIPTSDVRMKETCETLSKAHPNVVALVDGDGDGNRYAEELREFAVGARKVLRWPDGWTIEDVVCWIIRADEGAVMDRINPNLAGAPGDCATLLARLKSDIASSLASETISSPMRLLRTRSPTTRRASSAPGSCFMLLRRHAPARRHHVSRW